MSFLKENIEFFNTSGNNINPVYENGIYKSEIMFDRVSTSLFSTNSIHILEKCINVSDNNYVEYLTRPKTTNGQKLKVKFKNKNFQNFFFFRIDRENKEYFVRSVSNSDIDLQTKEKSTQPVNSLQDSYFDGKENLNKGEIFPSVKKVLEFFEYDLENTTEVGYEPTLNTESRIVSNIRHIVDYDDSVDGITINLGISSEEEGEYEETLQIYLVEGSEETLIAEFNLYCEVVGEDERFTNLLYSLGQELNEEDSIVFRETSVLEDYKDEITLNKKKKELILEYSNLIPYVGSYKGLINALKFYGYADLKLKEYWLNLETEQYFLEEYDKNIYKPKDLKRNSFNKILKKTGKFSLTYDITKEDTSVSDENNLPSVKRVDNFSQEEILLKLFGLKELLKRKFLPLNTRIVSIVGESVVFSYSSSSYYTQKNERRIVNPPSIEIDLKVTPKLGYLKEIDYTQTNTFPYSELTLSSNSTIKVSNVANFKLEDFENSYKSYDTPVRDSYCTVNIENKTFDVVIADLGFKLEDLNNIGNYTLFSAVTKNFYDSEWEISKKTFPPYYQKITGNVFERSNITVKIPYAGDYDVKLTLHDTNNSRVVKNFPSLFRVELPEPDFGMLYLKSNRVESFQSLNNKDLTFEKYGGMGLDFIYPDCKIEDMNVTFESVDPSAYKLYDVLDGIENLKIKSIDRNNKKVLVYKTQNDISQKLKSQRNLVFRGEYNPIYSIDIKDLDSENETIDLESKLDITGDVLEVCVETTVDVFTLTDGVITINDTLREDITKGCKVILSNSSKEDIFLVNKIDINKSTNVTKLTLSDEKDKRYTGVTYTKLKVYSNFNSYDVVEKISEDGNSIKYKIDWNSLSLPRTNDYKINSRVLKYTSPTFKQIGNGVENFETINIDFYDLASYIQNDFTNISKVREYILQQRYSQLSPNLPLNIDISEKKIGMFLYENLFKEYGNIGEINNFIFTNVRGKDLRGDFSFENLYSIRNLIEIKESLIEEKLVANAGLLGGTFAIKIDKIDFEKYTDSIEITLIDSEKELFYISKNFKVDVADYDIDFAERFLAENSFLLENLNGLKIQELGHLCFDDMSINPPVLPSFELSNVKTGSSIKIGNSPFYTFSKECSANVDTIIEELQTVKIKEFELYNYYKTSANTVLAVSKFPITESLNIIEYKGDIEVSKKVNPRYAHNYPLPKLYYTSYPERTRNNRAYHSRLLREWYGVNETCFVEKEDMVEPFYSDNINTNFQMSLNTAICGNFRIENLTCSTKGTTVKKYTTVMLYPDISNIYGKTEYLWTVTNQTTNERVLVSKAKNLAYTFSQEGFYDITLKVKDYKGNESSITKNGFLRVE